MGVGAGLFTGGLLLGLQLPGQLDQGIACRAAYPGRS